MTWAIWLLVLWPVAAFVVLALTHGAARLEARERSQR
jgi:hypothetical protein